MIRLTVNGTPVELDCEPDKPLLWALREDLGLTGTKYACGIARCHACTVHVDGAAMPSCRVPVEAVAGARVTTIEGLDADGRHPLQQAWVAANVPQCGYCQPGWIMAVAALLARNPAPSDADIDAALPNLCRCGTYPRIRAAIHAAVQGR
ncbi:MAG: (2Fe-2S)-binding protein [Gammaproteobacteria bacterium]|nr:(2Fe-2S)-binding protein [Gammaproteobacteria bacterium]